MKKGLWITWMLVFGFIACKDDDINLFDKPGDVRVQEAIAALKDDLVSADNGWILHYTPVDESGSYLVLLDFHDDNTITIRTDFTVEDGKYFEQTNTYRIDSSLGLEMIIENYSFFSYLFERDQATFLAEYEFDYVNKTSDGALVFQSKTDFADPTTVLLEPATASDVERLGHALASKLDSLANDFPDKIGTIVNGTTSVRLSIPSKNLAFDGYFDVLKRTINFWAVSRISNSASNEPLSYATGYHFDGNSLVFDNPLTGTFLSTNVSIASLQLSELTNITLDACGVPVPINGLRGQTSEGDPAVFESSILDISGTYFTQGDQYVGPIDLIFHDGNLAETQITQDLPGVSQMLILYNYLLLGGQRITAIGFGIDNSDGTITYAMREFTLIFNGNNIVFQFAPDVTYLGEGPPNANIEKVDFYLNALTQGNQTYVFKIIDNVYEFYNPCSNWSFAFIAPTQ